LKKEGFNDFEKEISIDLNTPYSANYNLATTPAGEYINKGRELIRKGLYNEGIEQLAEALKRNPEPTEMSQIHLLLGNAFLKTKTYDQALAYYQKAKESPENVLPAELGLAEAYAGLGQNAQALSKLIDIVLNTKDAKIRSQAETLYHQIYPMRSTIYVASEPAGAQVLINDKPFGVTPIVLSEITAGTYRLSVQLDGFKPYQSRVSLSLSQIKPVVVKLEPNPQ
ncbi:MAG: PEGA domain-containing protein, partial [Candidatus Binatia bacterium]